MEKFEMEDRRLFLKNLLFSVTLTALGLGGMLRHAVAMGTFRYPTGVQKLKGQVTLNDEPAKEGDVVNPGDLVATGRDSTVIFVFDKSVYLLRENTQVKVDQLPVDDTSKKTIETLKILKGKVLAVFNRKRRKHILTPTAVAGIRGSAAYVEAEQDKSYFCICYGTASLAAKDAPEKTETVSTRHHEAPRFILGPAKGNQITAAPVINHTDAELIMLEAMVGRKPPFVGYEESKKY